MIRDKDFLKKQIIGEKRHQFIYSYDDENRESFLNSIKEDYKISPDNDGPIAIVVEDFGLPKTKIQNINVNDKRTAIMAKEYLSLVIVEEIMKQILESYTGDNRESVVWGTIRWLNRVDKNPRKPYTTTEEELFNMFKEGKDFYNELYTSYLKGLPYDKTIDDIYLPFIAFEYFTDAFVRRIDKPYISIFINNKSNKEFAMESYRAVNSLISNTGNLTATIKVVTDSEKWPTSCDLNMEYIQNVHDYDYIELDDSYEKHIEKIRKKF